MNFGFSVGDFIAVGQLAYAVYQKCANAGGEYQGLAESVAVLRGILENAKVFLQKNVPDAPDKQQSLVVARYGCKAILEEVESFLKRYPSLGQNAGMRWIEKMKFITKDIDNLKAGLKTSGDNLQRCLTSLMSVSVLEVHRTLRELLAEYRAGKHEKSVISVALTRHQKVDRKEAMEQIETDLMDKDVHPDAIDIHQATIQTWLLETITEDGLSEEGLPDGAESSDGTDYRNTAKDDPSERDHIVPVRSIRSDPLQQNRSPVVPKKERKSSGQSSSHWTERPALTRDSSEEDLYGSSVGPGAKANASYLRRPEDNGRLDLLPPPSEAPSSRRNSSDSHASKESTWHPSSESDREYVVRMLSKPLQMEPIKASIDIEKASFYFKRAFHQQDFRNRGYLTRNEVTSICQEAMKDAATSINSQALTSLIHAGDQNKDGRVDRDEFINIMQDLLQEIYSLASQVLHSQYQDDIRNADNAVLQLRRHTRPNIITSLPSLPSLPWGFSRLTGHRILDEIEDVEVDAVPEPLPLHSFTLMAQEVAARSVQILDTAGQRWSEASPQGLMTTFNDTFDKMRDVALRFTILYNPNSEHLLSDLDEMVTVLHIVHCERPSDELAHRLKELRNLQVKCEFVACHVRGFVWRLSHMHIDSGQAKAPNPVGTSWPSARSFSTDLANWRRAHMETWAWLIAESEEFKMSWEGVDEIVSQCRVWYDKFLNKAPKTSSQSIGQSMSSGQRSPTFGQNVLRSEAINIARRFTATIRQMNRESAEELRRQPREFWVDNVRFESRLKKKWYSQAQSPKLKWEIRGIDDHIITGPYPVDAEIPWRIKRELPAETLKLFLTVRDTVRPSWTNNTTIWIPQRKGETGYLSEDIYRDSDHLAHFDAVWGVSAPGNHDFAPEGSSPWWRLVLGCFDISKAT